MFPEHIPEDIVDKLILLHSVFMNMTEKFQSKSGQ